MELITNDAFTALLGACGIPDAKIAGGSAANVIRGLAHLGWHCALKGKVGDDESSKIFFNSIKNLPITPLFIKSVLPTGRALCLVTPDGQRTMRTSLGASSEMTAEELHPIDFAGMRLVHIEGYSLHRQGFAERMIGLAKEAGAQISFDLASHETVTLYRERLFNLLKQVDIVIANADEAKALTGLEPKQSCAFLKEICPTALVLFGEGGCWVGQGSRLVHGPAIKGTVIDTTGAGDLFTSGFLHGYLKGKSLEECAYAGTLVANAVIQVLGPEISLAKWEQLIAQLS